jgi:wyosine [tRNA(Phe)-imidazoG37] synthetase (radical SAM superfamily)
MQPERRAFYEPERILRDVEEKVAKVTAAGEGIDYLTFVPDGEPTLDVNLGREIELLRPLGIRIAVITNASLIWREEVREALMKADWVSLKVDSVGTGIWRQVNRPYGKLSLSSIMDGALEFASQYRGELATETMLVGDLNDDAEGIRGVAAFLARLKPATAYLAIPTRPPAENWVQPPNEAVINRAFQSLSEKVDRVELLAGYEGNAFAFTGNIEKDLLSIIAVHPMRQDAVRELLARAMADWSIVDGLIAWGKLVEMGYQGSRFYMRKVDQGNKRNGDSE